MIVNIASYAKFGLFLAKEMYQLNKLGLLYTNLPNSMTKDIPTSHKKFFPLSTLTHIFNRFNLNFLSSKSRWISIQSFDHSVANNMTHCDIFHCFSSFGLKSHKIAKSRFGSKCIVERGSSHIEFQNEILKEEYKSLNIKYPGIDKRIIDKELEEYNFCDRIIVQSSFAKSTFIKKGFTDDKIITLPLGVNLNVFKKANKLDQKFRVLAVGTLSVRKGSIYLLKAIYKIHHIHKLKNFEFVFNGHIHDEILPIITNYRSLIDYVGTRPFDQLYKLYSQASVFVLPTIEDGFGNVIAEAMACGVPVIATTNCGSIDIISDGIDGFIVPIRDSNAILEKIIFLYENPDVREKMSIAALAKATMLLGTESHGNRALSKFQELLV